MYGRYGGDMGELRAPPLVRLRRLVVLACHAPLRALQRAPLLLQRLLLAHGRLVRRPMAPRLGRGLVR